MMAKLLLRIAAAIMLVHCVGHTFGQLGWKKDPDPAKHDVIKQMTGPRFPFMGVSRNMGDYFDGYGYAATISMLLIVFILWFTSGQVASGAVFARQIILTMSVCLLFLAVNEFLFFFPAAAITTLLACICCFWSWYLV